MKLLIFLLAASAYGQIFTGGNATKIRGTNVVSPLTLTDGCRLSYVSASTRFECAAGGAGNGIVAATVSAATSATLTHNAALSSPYVVPFTCREDTTNLIVIPASATFNTNSIDFTFSPAFTGKCAASTGGSGVAGGSNLTTVGAVPYVSASGVLSEATGITSSTTPNVTKMVIKASSAQSSTNLQEWQNNAGTVLSGFAPGGDLFFTSSTSSSDVRISRVAVGTATAMAAILRGDAGDYGRLYLKSMQAQATTGIAGLIGWGSTPGTYTTALSEVGAGIVGVGTGAAGSTAGTLQAAGYMANGGTKFTASGCSNSTTVGGATAGKYTSGTTGTCTVTITMNGATGLTATNGWACSASDLTTPANVITQSASSTTTATLTGTTTSGDVITFHCVGY